MLWKMVNILIKFNYKTVYLYCQLIVQTQPIKPSVPKL